jgi:hypothetical protein
MSKLFVEVVLAGLVSELLGADVAGFAEAEFLERSRSEGLSNKYCWYK